MPTYGANKAGHVVDDAAGEVERDVRLDGHEVEDDLPGEARHVARLPRYHREEGRLARQHLKTGGGYLTRNQTNLVSLLLIW